MILVGVPVALVLLVAGPLGLWRGEYQWRCALIALALVVPPGLITLILSDRLAKTSLFGPILALAVGTLIRVGVGFGGAAVVFLLNRATFEPDPLSFFGWVIGVYLVSLATETALLARANPTTAHKQAGA